MAAFPKIPGFELKKFLGSGGAADVFLAVDLKHSRLVAIKVLANTRFADTIAVRRFIKEAQTISRLHHPNIVRIHGTGKADALHYMVMEFLPESLKATDPRPQSDRPAGVPGHHQPDRRRPVLRP